MPLIASPVLGLPKPTERRFALIEFQGAKSYYSGNMDSQDISAVAGQSNTDGADSTTQATKFTMSTGSSGTNTYCGIYLPSTYADMRHDPVLEVVVKTPAVINSSKWRHHDFGFQDTTNDTPNKYLMFRLDALSQVIYLQALDSSVDVFGTYITFGSFSANTWYKCRLRADSATNKIYGSVNDGAESVLDCSIPQVSSLFTQTLRLAAYTSWQGANNTMELTLASLYYEFRAR